MQGAWGSIPGWGTKIPHADVVGKKNKLKKKKNTKKKILKKPKITPQISFLCIFPDVFHASTNT